MEQGGEYGQNETLAGVALNLEFVSANPTGPLHIGGVRWAAVGDSLARVLQASGAAVTREYYFNDHGAQIDRFSRSLLARALGEPAPEDGYGGNYISEIAEQVVADALAAGETDPRTLPFDEANEAFRARGVDLMFAEIRKSLEDFGVEFDVYFHEDSLHKSGAVDRAVARLRELGHVFEARRRDVAAHHDVRRRPRPRDHPVQRRGRLHRRRHRVLPGQAGARVRPRRHHARRRPPRVHRSHDGRSAPRSATPRASTSRSSSASW